MSEALWLGLALVLVFEGFLPFTSPSTWRNAMLKAASLSDRQIRLFGLCLLVSGAGLALLAR